MYLDSIFDMAMLEGRKLTDNELLFIGKKSAQSRTVSVMNDYNFETFYQEVEANSRLRFNDNGTIEKV